MHQPQRLVRARADAGALRRPTCRSHSRGSGDTCSTAGTCTTASAPVRRSPPGMPRFVWSGVGPPPWLGRGRVRVRRRSARRGRTCWRWSRTCRRSRARSAAARSSTRSTASRSSASSATTPGSPSEIRATRDRAGHHLPLLAGLSDPAGAARRTRRWDSGSSATAIAAAGPSWATDVPPPTAGRAAPASPGRVEPAVHRAALRRLGRLRGRRLRRRDDDRGRRTRSMAATPASSGCGPRCTDPKSTPPTQPSSLRRARPVACRRPGRTRRPGRLDPPTAGGHAMTTPATHVPPISPAPGQGGVSDRTAHAATAGGTPPGSAQTSRCAAPGPVRWRRDARNHRWSGRPAAVRTRIHAGRCCPSAGECFSPGGTATNSSWTSQPRACGSSFSCARTPTRSRRPVGCPHRSACGVAR